jgi:hypothetical protein
VAAGTILNSDLHLDDIPAPEASFDKVVEFARTFDGYTHWGSHSRCAEVANSRSHNFLTDLRTCLFFEQRWWNHFGSRPDPSAENYWRTLVELIRARVQADDRE